MKTVEVSVEVLEALISGCELDADSPDAIDLSAHYGWKGGSLHKFCQDKRDEAVDLYYKSGTADKVKQAKLYG